MTTVYGDITPRQAAFSMANLLKRAIPNMVIERFGQAYVVPKNNTGTAKFRRYFMNGATGSASGNPGDFSNPLAVVPLVEGVTPSGRKLENKDYTVQMQQYGDFIGFTDVIQDLHEDMPGIMRQMTDILGEQMAQTMETLRFNVLKAGTNVFYANGSARNAVNTPISLTLQRRITRSLKRQNAMPISATTGSSAQYELVPTEAAFIAVCHPDVENDIRGMAGFQSVKHYNGSIPGEIGQVEDVRYVRSTVFESFADAGGAKGLMLSTTGTSADVYPVIYMARDAFGTVALRGTNAASVMMVQPKPTQGDPLAQRGSVGWKAWNATVILQDAFMVRAEVAATE